MPKLYFNVVVGSLSLKYVSWAFFCLSLPALSQVTVSFPAGQGTPTGWQVLENAPVGGIYSGEITADGWMEVGTNSKYVRLEMGK